MIQPIQIRDFVVRLPDPLYPYQDKTRIQVRKATAVASPEPGWMPVTALVGQFFQPAFGKRNPLNIPGPFYGAETDTCETGTAEAPNNVLLDRSGQEFVFTQPRGEDELRDIISAAICECFVGYGADGDDHWTLALIREWWGSRLDLLARSSQGTGLPESKRRWERILSGEGETYLREYAFFVETRRLPTETDALPEIG
jgi:hypothetical protein